MSLILISHGDFCHGLRQTAEMITGEIPNVQSVSLNPEEGSDDFARKFEEALDKATGEIVVLSDIMGGTPCNVACRYLDRINGGLFGGMNLPMVLSYVSEEGTEDIVENAQSQIFDVTAELKAAMADNDDCEDGI